MAFAGLALYSVVNLVLVFVVLFAAMNNGGNPAWTAASAVVLALVGLGAGAGLLFVRRPWTTGLGLGLMIGWALWSIVSAGFCTGINPGLYG
ncbi:hypothetical protein [Nonomuraea roseoviolacea]|uniref:DUF4175 domain-containing protein n=1 Tax=Nonomuraea roseoviolacea subsp. carminata TaxID=160689 RepID=A0ABT1JZG1_9ACTN|nr:hypothetical protein [Nonomuraea roseoviolacea]MCP2347105.1 hypothetical protein [Nonomuraea roseoviolacea subsp. carminata]